jgi:hypothetical protein
MPTINIVFDGFEQLSEQPVDLELVAAAGIVSCPQPAVCFNNSRGRPLFRTRDNASSPGSAHAEHDAVAFKLLPRGLQVIDVHKWNLHRLARSKMHLAASVLLRYPGNSAQFICGQVATHGPEPYEERVFLVLRYDPYALEFVYVHTCGCRLFSHLVSPLSNSAKSGSKCNRGYRFLSSRRY